MVGKERKIFHFGWSALSENGVLRRNIRQKIASIYQEKTIITQLFIFAV